ncbi:MAG: LCP family protein [Faecousia sp.]
MENKRNGEDEFDDLLRQADALIDDDGQDYFHAPGGVDEESAPDGEYVGNIRNFNNNYGYQPEPAAPVIPAYNQDYREYSRNVRQAPVQQPVYQEPEPPVRETPKPKKKKKKHRFLKFLLVLAILLGGLGFWLSTLFVKPETDRPIGERKKDAVTILLCGTDMEGTRTDTMMLLYICAQEKAVNLVSLPRDTLTHTTSGKNAKLNSAFGRNNGKEDPVEGMENLMLYVRDIIGYMPDGYMLINLEGFVDVVDLMGGVEFNVPQDMYYEDSSQDLYIDLREGLQTLNGYDAMCLVRFRKGYSNQDLGRVEVQREFISACMNQWMKVSNVTKLPEVLDCLGDNATSDLTTKNLMWLALNAFKSGFGNIQTATLPGYADMIDGGSYYVLDPRGVAEIINEYCNPYVRDIDPEDLTIIN